ncbi:MAG: PhzF family phenazine biosynthesis isomerase, partial [Acidobacteriota bacterium]
LREVDFCGHATVATAVAWAERVGAGELVFETAAGDIPIQVVEESGGLRATLTSVPTGVTSAAPSDVDEVLESIGWRRSELDPDLPPRVAFGGVSHLVMAAGSRRRLADLAYDFDRLEALMLERRWITLQLVWRESDSLYHSRNPFPVGGVVEDPATGAAAAALGGYVREVLGSTGRFRIRQGEDIGRPSDLWVDASEARVRVSGFGQRIPG